MNKLIRVLADALRILSKSAKEEFYNNTLKELQKLLTYVTVSKESDKAFIIIVYEISGVSVKNLWQLSRKWYCRKGFQVEYIQKLHLVFTVYLKMAQILTDLRTENKKWQKTLGKCLVPVGKSVHIWAISCPGRPGPGKDVTYPHPLLPRTGLGQDLPYLIPPSCPCLNLPTVNRKTDMSENITSLHATYMIGNKPNLLLLFPHFVCFNVYRLWSKESNDTVCWGPTMLE